MLVGQQTNKQTNKQMIVVFSSVHFSLTETETKKQEEVAESGQEGIIPFIFIMNLDMQM